MPAANSTTPKVLTLAEIARVRGEDVDTLARVTAANARSAFVGLV